MKKFLFDLFPLILFFAAYKFAGIYVATGVAMAAALLQILWIKLRGHAVETMHWVNLSIIVVFGGATLWLQNEAFIKWKPTVLYWVMGGALLIGQLVFKKNGIRSLMGSQMRLPEAVWQRVNLSWAAFFTAMGCINLWVAYSFSTSAWVNFKLFGGLGLMFAFVAVQAIYLNKYMTDKDGAA